jgi:ABC-type multidrug transport system fused ATPase/permease subunit
MADDNKEAESSLMNNIMLSSIVFMFEMILDKLRERMNRSVAEDTADRFFDLLFDKIIHAPIPTYFDITPSHRIMEHFHRDLRAFDMHTLYMTFEFLIQIQLVGYAAYQVMFNLPILAIIMPLIIFRNQRIDNGNRKQDEKKEKCLRVFWETYEKIINANFEGVQLMRAFGNQQLIVKFSEKVSIQKLQIERLNSAYYNHRDFVRDTVNEFKTMFILLVAIRQRGIIPALLLTMVIEQVDQMEGGIWYMKHIYDRNKDSLKSIQKILNFEQLE